MTSNKTNVPRQTIDGSKITAKQLQPLHHCNFHVLMTFHIMTKLTNPINHDQRHKYHHLTDSSLDSEDGLPDSGSQNILTQRMTCKTTAFQFCLSAKDMECLGGSGANCSPRKVLRFDSLKRHFLHSQDCKSACGYNILNNKLNELGSLVP